MKNWIKISEKDKSKIRGGFAFSSAMAVWGMTLLTSLVIRSLFSNKTSATINGVGRVSWENKENKNLASCEAAEQHPQGSNLELEKFMSKFYEF